MAKLQSYSRVVKNKKLKIKKYLPHIFIVLIALILTIPLLKSQNILSSLRQSEKSSAAGVECSSTLNISVSNDRNYFDLGIIPITEITLPRTSPRYYIRAKAVSNGSNCSNRFEALATYCDLAGANCTSYPIASPWGIAKSNSQGVARVDLSPFKNGGSAGTSPWSETMTADGIYKAQFRPYFEGVQNNIPWSNQVTITVDNRSDVQSRLDSTPPDVNMQDYYVYNPGDAYLYDSISTRKNAGGSVDTQTYTTRMQIEQERSICGINVRPWRFTKDNMRAYWEPHTIDGFRNLRWMIVSPNFDSNSTALSKSYPDSNYFIWGLRDKIYNHIPPTSDSATLYATDPMGLRDISPSAYSSGLYYGSTTGRLPSYSLTQKSQRFPFLSFSQGESYYFVGDGACPTTMVNRAAGQSGSWMYRAEKDSVTTPAGTFSDVARVDYFESTNPLKPGTSPFTDSDNFLRESWYFARGVGLVEVRTKLFNGVMYNENGVSGVGLINSCSKDSDCMNDTIDQPFTRVTLKQYTPASTTFNIQVSRDSSTGFSNDITTTPTLGYYVKVSSNYTGYLEVKESNSIAKWIWVANGQARVDLPTSIVRRKYIGQVRVWAPNDVFDNEQLLNNYNAPWSNDFSVTVADTLPYQALLGNFDAATAVAGGIRISGWAFDPDLVTWNTNLSLYIDGVYKGTLPTNILRQDINDAYSSIGLTGNHGFDKIIQIEPGTHIVDLKMLKLIDNNEIGYTLPYSPKSVTVLPPVPDPVSPPLQATCNATGTQAQVSWNASVRATSYLFRADRQTDPMFQSCPSVVSGGGDVCTGPLTTTSYLLVTNPNTPYNIWVHASNSAGNSAPTNLAVNCSVNNPPTGSLNSVTSPAYNTINIQGTASDPNTTAAIGVKIFDNGALVDTTTGPTFNRTITNRSAGVHTIKVVALDDKTLVETEIFGSPKTVTVTDQSIVIVPKPVTSLQATCNASGTTAQISWNPSEGATSYLFRADRQADGWSGVCPLNTPNGGDQCTSNIIPTNFTLTTNPNTPYNVWVHASNSAGNSSAINIGVNCTVNRLPVGVLNNVTSPDFNIIQVQATASDPDTANPIVLKIYDNSVLAQTVTTLNLNTTLVNRTSGIHTIKVTATDAQTGQEIELTGSPKTVTVQNSATIVPTPTATAVPTPIGTTTNFTVLAAGGATAGLELPIFELRYKDTIVGSPTRTTGYMATYNFNVPTTATIGDFKVVFTNDYSSNANGTYVDRDLRVDSVSFKGITYRSDAQATYSTGSWTSSTGCASGYKSSVWLHCNGYFQYASTPIGPTDPTIIQAENYVQTTGDNISGFNGVENRGSYIARFDLGDTVSYQALNLSGKTSVTFNYMSRIHPGYIEVRQDSTSGQIIGKIYTGSIIRSSFGLQTVPLISGLSGSHTIHLVARDAYGVADIDWFEFK